MKGGLALKVNIRIVVFVLVVLAAGIIFVIPYLDPGPGGESGKNSTRSFAVTPNPGEKLEAAQAQGRPVFLEFYAVT